MSGSSALDFLRSRLGRLGMVALAVSVLPSLPAFAQADGGAAGKLVVEGVIVRPVDPERVAGKPVVVILGETGEDRRNLNVSLPVYEGRKAYASVVRAGNEEIAKSFTSQAERFDEFVDTERREDMLLSSSGVVTLEQVVSRIEMEFPKEVSAGSKIEISVKGVGEATDVWDAWLVYPTATYDPTEASSPDGSRYEQQTMKIGAKTGGEKTFTASFATYSPDKGGVLGVCVSRRTGGETAIGWVQIR